MEVELSALGSPRLRLRTMKQAGSRRPCLTCRSTAATAGSFNSERLTVDDVRRVAGICRRHGIGSFCPTLVTNASSALLAALNTLRKACEGDSDLASGLPAFHLEGPYISEKDGPRSAHPRQHVRPPDWNEFRRLQDASGGRIRLVTLAPETEGALPFIEKLVASGIVVAIGHTAASGAQIRDAITAAPDSALIWGTGPTISCIGTRTTFGSSSRPTNCARASSAMDITCRLRSSAVSCASRHPHE